MRIVEEDRLANPGETGAEYYFRGESMNYHHRGDNTAPLETDFPCYLNQSQQFIDHERDLYQEALRYNIISFAQDTTMVERLARMQHYRLPTRLCDISNNILLAAFFACGGERMTAKDKKDDDGYIRVIKVAPWKMKSFTSDIIVAIAHLPLVKPKDVMPSEQNGLEALRYEVTNERPGFSMNVRVGESSDRMFQLEAALRREIQHVWAFKPILNNRRIRAQGGLFLAFGCGDGKKKLEPSFSPEDYEDETKPSFGIKQIGYVQVHNEAKPKVLEDLRMFGMPAENVYPDLSDACYEIAERCKQGEK
ncbi:MAG: FRG domain-containing protein [Erysipelotrichaceae bacterium]|nr:FRG domain-containing protein [Erysipelotrichaceae bacterium]